VKTLKDCFDANRAWSDRMRARDPAFFERLVGAQTPELLWIGCSDSRLPPDQVVGRLPGEIFVHRNVGNVVVHTDLNCLSVLQYGIEVLKVRHVIVCGHYGCGGVRAALYGDRLGLADHWLRHVQDVRDKHMADVQALPDDAQHDRLCELNVLEQAANICRMNLVRDAWERGQPLTVHAWIYGLKDGLVRDLGLTVRREEDLVPRYRAALAALSA
jgi:carbonic anhydrase